MSYISYCGNAILGVAVIFFAWQWYAHRYQHNLDTILFKPLRPYAENYLRVSPIHEIWYAEYGNPKGVPVVVLHGGPGMGCSPNDMRYFDPSFYRIMLLDQRGANRSKPYGEMAENTTQHLISDLESLRHHLNIDKWVVFGGSWGSALSLAYGQAHPERCLGFILRGVFAGRKHEGDQVWYGMKDIFPEEWQALQDFLPPEERSTLAESYCKRILNPDRHVSLPAIRAFMIYDLRCSFLTSTPEQIKAYVDDEKPVVAGARTFAHYYMNHFFFKENQLLENLPKITHLPAIIVHGRYDIVCRPQVAYEVHMQWPGSQLVLVDGAGHSAREPGIAKALVAATEQMKGRMKKAE